MKIFFLCPEVPPSTGGVAQYTAELAAALRRKGAEVDIFTSAGRQEIADEIRPWTHAVIGKWEGPHIADVLETRKLAGPFWVIMQYVPQLYHRSGIAFEAAKIPAILKKRLDCQTAVTFHEFYSGWGAHPRDLFLAFVTRLQTRILMKGCDKAITTCERYEKDLRKISATAGVRTVPVSSNIKPYSLNADERKELVRRLGLEDCRVFSVFGTMSKRRNFETGLDILRLAGKKGIQARMMLIGNMGDAGSPVMIHFRKLAEKMGVTHLLVETGRLSAENVSKHLQMSDAVIFPQVDGISTRSTALMSALEHGLKIVAYRPVEGNFSRPLPAGVEAVQTGDSDAFKKAVLRALEAPRAARYSQENADFFRKHFTWDSAAEAYLEFLKEEN